METNNEIRIAFMRSAVERQEEELKKFYDEFNATLRKWQKRSERLGVLKAELKEATR